MSAEAAFNAVGEKAVRVTDIVGVIADAATEQSEQLRQIFIGVEQVSGVVQTNAATAEESAAAAEQLSAQADTLEALVNKLKGREGA